MKNNHTDKSRQMRERLLGANQYNILEIIQTSPLGIIILDLNGEIVLWNQAAEKITGWNEHEVIGFNIRNFVNETWGEYDVQLRRTLNREIFHSLPLNAVKKDNQKIMLSYSTAPLFDNDRIVATIAVIYDITEKIALETALKDSLVKMERVQDDTVNALAAAIEKRDPYTAGHQQRVTQLACAIAEKMGRFDSDRIKGLRMSATIHDIGKLYVPAEILAKPGQLSELELALIKTHPQAGFDILGEIEFPWPIARIVQQHHERLDGRGYPLGLTGEAILMEARIIGVADVVEAMSSHRPYRPSRGIEAALHEIKIGRGNIYDANTVDACVALFSNGYMLRDEQP